MVRPRAALHGVAAVPATATAAPAPPYQAATTTPGACPIVTPILQAGTRSATGIVENEVCKKMMFNLFNLIIGQFLSLSGQNNGHMT